jgi:hypothetical protein
MKFSIVIPTRERCDTLLHCLRTCTMQEYEDLEIIVSDNASEDATHDVVAACGDPRVRYVNTGARLSMAGNWEFALQHVTGQFVTYVGDDDGLLPHAVRDVAGILRDTGSPALSWMKAEYAWPNHPDEAARNQLSIPLGSRLFHYSSDRIIRDLCRLWIPYTRAPVIYNSFVSMHALRSCVNGTGRFFHSVTPDVYSGMALLSQVSGYHYSLRPFSVNGASGHSNGTCAARIYEGGEASGPTGQFLRENDIALHPDFPMKTGGSVIGVVIEAFLQASDHCFGGGLRIDLPQVVSKIVREVAGAAPVVYQGVVAQLRDVCGGRRDLERALDKALRRYPNSVAGPAAPPRGLSADNRLHVDAATFGVANVDDAARLVHEVIGEYHQPDRIRVYSSVDKLSARIIRKSKMLIRDDTL